MAPHGESCPTRILRALALPARLSNPGATGAEVAGDPTVAPPPSIAWSTFGARRSDLGRWARRSGSESALGYRSSPNSWHTSRPSDGGISC